jgi:hypothetical protein
MKKYAFMTAVLLTLLLLNPPLWAKEVFKISHSDIESVKKVLDDPAPFYTNCQYFKKWLPQEVWDMLIFDENQMKTLWAEVVGLKAPEEVGKIVPEITPGKYTLKDKDRLNFKQLMPEYFYNKFNEPGTGPYPNLLGNFTEFEVVPTRQYYRSLPIAEATKKYMGTVKQDENGYLLPDSYIAGLPFPRPAGPHKAMQIIYNYTFGFAMINWDDSIALDNVIGVNKDWKIDHVGKGTAPIINTVGRVHFKPYGWLDERAKEQKEQNILRYTVLEPRDIYGNIYCSTAYIAPEKDTTTLAYVNVLRRVRKLSSSDKQDQAVGQDIAMDDSWGFTQKLSPVIYPYEYKIIEEREFLVPVMTLEGDSYIDSKEKFKYRNLKFERRPLWVVEMKQKDPNYIYSKRIWYVDKETLMPLALLFYDQKDRLYRTFINYMGFIPSMGIINFFQNNNEDLIDTHSTFSFTTAYPNPYLERNDAGFKSLMKAK